MDVYTGIDVSKGRLDVAVRPAGERWVVANNPQGIDDLVARLEGLRPSLIVLGDSGGYERPVVAALASAGLPVAAINPRQARDFAATIARRRQVVGMLVAEGDRLETSVPPVRGRLEAHIAFLKGGDR